MSYAVFWLQKHTADQTGRTLVAAGASARLVARLDRHPFPTRRSSDLSFLLALFGGRAGQEGAAIEAAQGVAMAARPRSARWFEQRRRTDAAIAVAAGKIGRAHV